MGEDKRSSEGKAVEKGAVDTPIQNMYTFWYIKRSTGNKAVSESYEKSIKGLGDFKTVQDFWKIYNHLVRPNDLPNTMDYHLFKTGIKPMWEDAANRRGGKWMVRLRKGIASRYWEDLVLAIIGEQFDVGNEICGAVISIRYNEDIISLWNRNADNNEACYRIRDTMRKVLNLPQFVALEYKRHDTSLSDNSSFRNTTLWRSDKAGGNNGEGSSGGERSSTGSRFSREKFDKSSGHQRSAWSRENKRSFYKNDSNDGHHRNNNKSNEDKTEGRCIVNAPKFFYQSAMEQHSQKIRNKGVAVSALIRDEQERYRLHDHYLSTALDEVHEYMTAKIDPILTKALEEVLLYQPDQTADFLANAVRGTLNLKKYNYVELKRQVYFDRKVRHLMVLATNSAIRERPVDLPAYLADLFESRSKFY
ncbi:hypothetical protein BBJ29_002342 [Phytophthora kernoviae]|uniref:Uncharacterized protein n=2 Tax=Phytophthora kernoviae TaxID=325452 RepID=A0A421G3K6_9STRA|nr:hypothetical protein BBJ29_002342 [Phytophthora kernoviae]